MGAQQKKNMDTTTHTHMLPARVFFCAQCMSLSRPANCEECTAVAGVAVYPGYRFTTEEQPTDLNSLTRMHARTATRRMAM